MKKSYIKIDNAVSEKSSEKLFRYIVKLINFYEPNFNKRNIKFDGWEDREFNDRLINLRNVLLIIIN